MTTQLTTTKIVNKNMTHLLARSVMLLCPLSVFIICLTIPTSVLSDEQGVIAQGKAIAFHRHKGNCLACHAIEGGLLPGNIGPPLISMQDRYQNKSQLREQIWDATVNNPHTIMPPFGKHKILTEEEIDKVVAFIYTL